LCFRLKSNRRGPTESGEERPAVWRRLSLSKHRKKIGEELRHSEGGGKGSEQTKVWRKPNIDKVTEQEPARLFFRLKCAGRWRRKTTTRVRGK